MLEELAKPGVTSAPTWIELVFSGLGISAAAFWARVQIRRGKTEAATPPQAELAMVTLDNEALKQVASAIEALNVTISEQNAISRQELADRREERDEAREAEVERRIAEAERRGYERSEALRQERREPPRRPRAT